MEGILSSRCSTPCALPNAPKKEDTSKQRVLNGKLLPLKKKDTVLAFSYFFTRANVLSKVGRQKKRRGLLMRSPKILEMKQSFNL
jgi:hypothetical protein